MSKLLFDGHEGVEIAPCVFKFEEPWEFDPDEWNRQNVTSGYTAYYKDNKMCYILTEGVTRETVRRCWNGLIPEIKELSKIKTLCSSGYIGGMCFVSQR